MIEGRATPEGTARFRDRAIKAHGLPAAHFRTAPFGVHLASLGIGTYLGGADAETDRMVTEAVSVALRSGRTNVVDTAINYRDQRAERSVGRALERSIAGSSIARDEVFVATKAGYLAPDGESGRPPERWIREELLATGALDAADLIDGSHAMSPTYLADQLERSRRNLGLATIDLLYLHNAADAQLAAIGPEAFGERLRSAFRRLEGERARGTLGAYGLATWEALRAAPGDPGLVQLADLLEAAEDAGGPSHGFRFVQLPFNRAMPEASERRNQRVGEERLTPFDAARRLGIACLSNVPLLQGRLARGAPVGGRSPAQAALEFARSTPGILTVLVGVKRPDHLAEDLAVAGWPPGQ